MLAAVRRQWWIPCVTTLVALVFAWATLATSGAPVTVHEGRATIVVDVATISKYPTLPSSAEVIAASKSEEFLQLAAKASGLSTQTIASDVDIYTLGAAQAQLIVAYASSDESAALAGARTVGEALEQEARTLGDAEISVHKRIINMTEQARDDVVAIEKRDGDGQRLRSAESVHAAWQMLTTLQQEEAILKTLENTYSLRGATTVVVATASRRSAQRLATAALLGLIAGFVLATLREALMRRARRSA